MFRRSFLDPVSLKKCAKPPSHPSHPQSIQNLLDSLLQTSQTKQQQCLRSQLQLDPGQGQDRHVLHARLAILRGAGGVQEVGKADGGDDGVGVGRLIAYHDLDLLLFGIQQRCPSLRQECRDCHWCCRGGGGHARAWWVEAGGK